MIDVKSRYLQQLVSCLFKKVSKAVSVISDLVYGNDHLANQLYGLTEEELDFIIRSALPLASSKNYDIKYRMGDELNENE